LDEIEGEFNAALAVFWWSHLKRDQMERFLRILHSRLQPGSRVVFIDNIYVEGSSTPISRCDAEGNTYQLRKLGDGSTTEVLKNFPIDETIAEVLRDSTHDLKIERLTYYWLARYTTRN
jgi:demethylmenaquinone methyltransferase/2-methoxy-6-polyprenyl-1,4-benzoquinol methylase